MTGTVVATIAYVVFIWWFSTGALFLLVRRPSETYHVTLLFMTVLASIAAIGFFMTLDRADVPGALVGFTCGLIIWAWHEMSFLFGHLTGPRKMAAPKGVSASARFRAAFMAIRDHELAIFATLLILFACSWNADNRIAAFTFAILWAMRISAKLNLHFGTPHLAGDLLPGHLRYLSSYFKSGPITPFFGLSVTVAAGAFIALLWQVSNAQTAYETISLTLITSLLGLAIVEHIFMVLPLRDSALWTWMNSDRSREPRLTDKSISVGKDRIADDKDQTSFTSNQEMRHHSPLSAMHVVPAKRA